MSSPAYARVRTVAWLNLIGNLAIIGTGGAVRLTASGLGCTNAVIACTADSFFANVDEGVHSIIEQSNRGLGVVVGILGILAVLAVWSLRGVPRPVWLLLGAAPVLAALGALALFAGGILWAAIPLFVLAVLVLLSVAVWAVVAMASSWSDPATRRDLWGHAWILALGVAAQGAIGGVVVATRLEMSTVGVHYVISAVLVGVATSFVLRAHRAGGPRERAVPRWLAIATHVASLLMALVVLGGVLTTQSGPHSGDEEIVRDTSAWETFAHVHAWLGYALGAALVAVLVGAFTVRARRLAGAAVLTVGVIQARSGIPPLLVGIHMVLAGVSVAALVVLVDALKRPAASIEQARGDDSGRDSGQASPSFGGGSSSRLSEDPKGVLR